MRTKIILTLVCAFVLAWPKCIYSQWVHDAMDQPSPHYGSISRGVSEAFEALNSKSKRDKSTWRDREEERKETERKNTLRNASHILNYSDNDEYRSMIFYESEFRERLKNELSCSRNILDYYKDDDEIRKLVMSDPSLQKKVKDKILAQKESILDLAKDPNLQQLIQSDSFLKECYDLASKAREELRKKQRRMLYEAEERERKKRQEVEKQRLMDERIRAKVQEEKNNKERIENDELKNEFLSSSMFAQTPSSLPLAQFVQESKPMFGINYQDDLTEEEYFDELLGTDSPCNTRISNKSNQNAGVKEMNADTDGDSYIKAKLDCAVYDSREKLEKGWEASKREITTIVKEMSEKTRKRVVSVPVNKVKAETNRIIEKIYPGYEMGKKVEVISKIDEEEKGFVQEILQCISKEAVDAVATGDIKKFEECVNGSKDTFVGQVHSHIETLSGVNYRRYMPWLTKKEKTDENEG